MPGVLAWGYYPTDKIWLPIQVDSAGRPKVNMSAINLGDLADVDLTGVADDDFMYYDQATGLWKPRKLVDADIPATICRDSELSDHAALPDVHHATHLKTLADHPLSIIPTMDDDHIPSTIARDSEVDAAVVAEAIARIADVDAEETARAAADSDHAVLDTGVHSAGANHLALFGVASTVVTKFTPKTTALPLWRGRDYAFDSPFEALINGAPTATSVVYDNDVRENSLPGISSYPQWGKVILHNITRGNSRKITNVNLATNTITTEASTDDWADNDIITIGSQTAVTVKAGHTYSSLWDEDISAEVPATATSIVLFLNVWELSGVGAVQNNMQVHPFESYATSKAISFYASAAYQGQQLIGVIPIVSRKICISLGRYGNINASGTSANVRILGYWE